MDEQYTIEEAIRRYGSFMHDFGELRQKKRVVEATGIYTKFPEAGNVLDRIIIYREITSRNFPQIFETVNPDLNELEKLCIALQQR